MFFWWFPANTGKNKNFAAAFASLCETHLDAFTFKQESFGAVPTCFRKLFGDKPMQIDMQFWGVFAYADCLHAESLWGDLTSGSFGHAQNVTTALAGQHAVPLIKKALPYQQRTMLKSPNNLRREEAKPSGSKRHSLALHLSNYSLYLSRRFCPATYPPTAHSPN